MNILYAIPALVWLIMSAIVFAVGEYMSKKWALNPSWTFVILIAVIYAIEAILWLPAMLQKNQLSVTGVLWSLLATIATVAIGLIFFHEHLSLTQFLGIAFALAAITMLNI